MSNYRKARPSVESFEFPGAVKYAEYLRKERLKAQNTEANKNDQILSRNKVLLKIKTTKE